MIAAGSAIGKFSLNLSFILQPCVFVAAIVVSEMKERLSPNIEPPITAPTQSGRLSSARRTHRHRDYTCDHEQSDDRKIRRDDRKQQICSTRRTACSLCDAAERTCHQEDEQHRCDVLITYAGCTDFYFFIKIKIPVLYESHHQAEHECDYRRHYVKSHSAFYRMDILKIYTAPQVEYQKHDYRQQCRRI